jgi:hypothetical protein
VLSARGYPGIEPFAGLRVEERGVQVGGELDQVVAVLGLDVANGGPGPTPQTGVRSLRDLPLRCLRW